MLYLKSCPRCTGDINADSDTHGTFLKCLQCGFSKDLSPEMAARLFGGASTGRPIERTAYPDQNVA
jgi:DNA-directed RNA polymerase subunit M/transcription elongation factor TFIIS